MHMTRQIIDIIKSVKVEKAKPCNDNRHDQNLWEFLHVWLDFWFEKNDIPKTYVNYNRALHYNYELVNRPWLSSDQQCTDAINWLEEEAIRLGVITVAMTRDDLIPYM